MTTHEQCMHLAVSQGWEYTHESSSDEGFPWKSPSGEYHHSLPPYDTSLDALHEVECGLTDEQHERFRHTLMESVKYPWRDAVNYRSYVSADAPTRLAALCKTLGLWTDTTLSPTTETKQQ